jgi:hypothetical protein
MSFLNQLKSQAHALQSERTEQDLQLDEKAAETEKACAIVLPYLQDLARQLNVIQPPGPPFTLDGKVPWPAMKLCDFRVDARRKMLRNREAIDYMAMGWQILPQVGEPVGGVVSVNFPPELQRVESRLALGQIKNERTEIRHPEKNVLQAIRFDYLTKARGGVTVTPEHHQAQLVFRLLNVAGFEVVHTRWPAARINLELMDELAKHVLAQPNRFV